MKNIKHSRIVRDDDGGGGCGDGDLGDNEGDDEK